MKAILSLIVLTVSLGVARANVNFTIYMTGAQESPANGSLAAGGGIASFDPVADTIDLSAFFIGLTTPITAAHIHDGAPGVNGPVIVSFVPFIPSPATTGGSIVGAGLSFPAAYIPDLMAGNMYFNIHTATYPGGEIRGQLVPVPEPSTLALAGVGLAVAGVALKRRLLPSL